MHEQDDGSHGWSKRPLATILRPGTLIRNVSQIAAQGSSETSAGQRCDRAVARFLEERRTGETLLASIVAGRPFTPRVSGVATRHNYSRMSSR